MKIVLAEDKVMINHISLKLTDTCEIGCRLVTTCNKVVYESDTPLEDVPDEEVLNGRVHVEITLSLDDENALPLTIVNVIKSYAKNKAKRKLPIRTLAATLKSMHNSSTSYDKAIVNTMMTAYNEYRSTLYNKCSDLLTVHISKSEGTGYAIPVSSKEFINNKKEIYKFIETALQDMLITRGKSNIMITIK